MAYARNFVDHQWYEYDDSHVRPVSASAVQKVEAYVLFYQRDTKQQQAEVSKLYRRLLDDRVWLCWSARRSILCLHWHGRFLSCCL